MRSMLLCVVAALAVIGGPLSAQAQSAYLSASLTGEIVIASHVEGDDSVTAIDGGGQGLGFAVRAGTPLGTAWGIEGEFLRPTAIDNEAVEALASSGLSYTFNNGVVPGSSLPLSLPRIYRVQISDRTTTVSAGLWVRQEFTARVAIVYIGGLGIHRMDREMDLRLDLLAIPGLTVIPGLSEIPLPTARREIVSYAMRPFVGAETRIGMGDRIELVAGLRVHGVIDALIVRPSIGAGWRF